jgi:hypothetical protein
MSITAPSDTQPVASEVLGSRWAEWLLLLCIVLASISVIRVWYRQATLPYQVDYGEGLMLEGALRIRQGQPLYPAPSGLPVVLHVYGPLAYVVTSLTLPPSGASFLGGRVLMLFCALCVSALMFIILKRSTRSLPIALTFGVVLLTVPIFRFWLDLLRADLIGIAFSVIGIGLYLFKPRYTWWSVPFFTAAVFCKYTLLAAPVAVFLHLLLAKKFTQAIGFAGLMGGLCASLFALLQYKTAGAFAFHMFATHRDPYSFAQFVGFTGLVWLTAPVVTALAIFYVARTIAACAPDFASLYFMAACATSLTAGKLGSSTNHFLEWIVAASLCAGLGFATLRTHFPRKVLPVAFALGTSVLVGAVVQTRAVLNPSPELSGCRDAYQFVASSNSSRILSQSLGPLLLNQKTVLVTDPFTYGQLVEHGSWPDSILEGPVNEQYFDLIITSVDPEHMQPTGFSIWPRPLLDAMARHYRVVQRFNCRDGSLMLEPRSPR